MNANAISILFPRLVIYFTLPQFFPQKKGDKTETAAEGGEGEPAAELTEEEKKRNSRLRKVEKKMKVK